MNLHIPFFQKFKKLYRLCHFNAKQQFNKNNINTYYMLDSGTGEMRLGKMIPSFEGSQKS